MKVVIRMSKREALKAQPILLRHSPGMILRDRSYIIDESAAKALRDAGVRFTELSREGVVPPREGFVGERI